MGRVTIPLFAYLWRRCRGCCSGRFVDSAALWVCEMNRNRRYSVFDGLAAIGKNTMGWFYGFKLHLVINDRGDLLGFVLTPGNVDDRQPIPTLTQGLWGKLFGDKGYISKRLFGQF